MGKDKKRFMVKAGNLNIIPLSPEEIEAVGAMENEVPSFLLDPVLENKKELREYFDSQSKNYFWVTLWKIVRIDKDRTVNRVGYLRFHGVPELGQTEISIEIEKYSRNRNYATDALKAVSSWAFLQKEVYEINAHFHRENDSAERAFTKAGYVFRNEENKIQYYSRVKESSAWGGLYLVIGIWAGLAFGIIFNNLPMGIGGGVVIGVICGAILENVEKEKRKEITGTKATREKRVRR